MDPDALLGDFESAALRDAQVAAALEMVRAILPICRSITGDGVRQTLRHVAAQIPLEVHEVPSGTAVFDWEVPREWNVRDAYIADASGTRVVDFRANNLHLMSYSVPVDARMTLDELQPHLFSIPAQPDWIPYRTSYYRDAWGFCLSQRRRDALAPGEYRVVVDTTLAPGSLTYAECFIPGQSREEFLVSTHVCHPGLANDNCAGIALATRLAAALRARRPRLSYRFVFAPGTIGAITWLARHRDAAARIRAGLVIGLLGDPGPLTYKRSRRGHAEVDLIAARALQCLDPAARVIDFSPYGYDERQYGSPGFNLPVGRLTRSTDNGYPQYHTSADDLALLRPASLSQSLLALARIVSRVDRNRRFRNTSPFGEPRLGKRGLFRSTGGKAPADFEQALLWLLNCADGEHGLLDTVDLSGLPAATMAEAAEALIAAGLLEET